MYVYVQKYPNITQNVYIDNISQNVYRQYYPKCILLCGVGL